MTCGFRLFEFVCCGVDFKVVSIKTEINLNFEKQKECWYVVGSNDLNSLITSTKGFLFVSMACSQFMFILLRLKATLLPHFTLFHTFYIQFTHFIFCGCCFH